MKRQTIYPEIADTHWVIFYLLISIGLKSNCSKRMNRPADHWENHFVKQLETLFRQTAQAKKAGSKEKE